MSRNKIVPTISFLAIGVSLIAVPPITLIRSGPRIKPAESPKAHCKAEIAAVFICGFIALSFQA